METKLSQLSSICKYGFSIQVNDHRCYYQTVEKYFSDLPQSDDLYEIEPCVFNKMKELDTIVSIQCYPNTSIGFYLLYHYDIDDYINKAIELCTDAKQYASK